MSQFKLTLKSADDKELDSKFVKAIMKRLYQDFELIDDPDLCDSELSESYTEREIRDLSVLVNGNDFPTSVNALGALILVGENRGDDNCTNCGYPEYYYTGGFTGGFMYCEQCEHRGPTEPDISFCGDIADYNGRIVL